jgi:hypothetical protein
VPPLEAIQPLDNLKMCYDSVAKLDSPPRYVWFLIHRRAMVLEKWSSERRFKSILVV